MADAPSITVTPSILKIDLTIDKPTATLYYKNNSSQMVELSLSTQDFTDLNDGWQVKFLSPKDTANYKYGLSSWISFDRKSVIIDPGKTASVVITIETRKLSQGGHYAAVLARVAGDSQDKSKVAINGVLSSLLFVRAGLGKVREEAKISDFEPVRNTAWDFPKSTLLRFENSGNIDLTPYGLIEVFNSQKQLVASGILNEGSLITLPESIRTYEIPLRQMATLYIPGVYTATITLHFGKSKKIITKSVSFFSEGNLPWILIIPGILVLFLVVWRLVKRKFLSAKNSI